MGEPTEEEEWADELEVKLLRIREAATNLASLCDSDLAEFIGDAESLEGRIRAAVLAERERAATEVNPYLIACPYCFAKLRDECQDTTGIRIPAAHAARWRAAIRKKPEPSAD